MNFQLTNPVTQIHKVLAMIKINTTVKVTSAKKLIFPYYSPLCKMDFFYLKKECVALIYIHFYAFGEPINFKICDIIIDITAH